MLAAGTAAAAGARVLTVGTYHGHPGRYSSIQQAVNAAHKGDWILVGPGDYHERNDLKNPPKAGSDVPPSGVLDQDPRPPHPRDEPQPDDRGRHQGGRQQAVQRREEVPGLRCEPGRLRTGPKRHRGLEDGRRHDPEPDHVQLPGRLRKQRQRDLVERRRRQREARAGQVPRRLPQHHDAPSSIRRTRTPRRSTGCSRATRTARGAQPRPTRATSTTPTTTSAPAGSCATRRSTTPGRSTAHSATRAPTPAGDWWSRTPSSTTTRTASTPTARTTTIRPHRRTAIAPRRARSARSPTPSSCWAFIHNYVHDNNNPNVPAAGAAASGRWGPG